MKNFFKKLAFVLALAMVVTAVAPAASASAAKAPVLNTTSKKLYLEKDVATGKYTNTFTLKVWNKGDYRVTFTSKNPEVATVSKWYGTVKAVAPGEATIVATVSNKSTGKVVKTLTSKVWVKRNAVEVGVSTASAAKLDNALNVGDKVKLNVFRKDLNGKTAWQQADKTIVTDYTVWTSSNTSVATVDKWGTVTAVAPGTAKITVRTAQTEAPAVATANVVELNVTVKSNGITNIKQTTSNTIEVTFGSEMDTVVNKDTLVITPASSTYQTPIVKSVKFDETKTVATVETFNNFEDGVVYSLSVKDNADITGEFKASVGKVASIEVTGPSSVVITNDAAKIEYVLKDANGVEVKAGDNARVEFEIIEGDQNGYLVGDTVSVFEAGKKIVIKATYYTGEFTTEGTEIALTSNSFVVTGVSKTDATLVKTQATLTSKNYADIDWKNFTANNKLALGDNNYKIELNVTDSNKVEYTTKTDAKAFTFESLDSSKVEVDVDGNLYPIAVGTAYVKVTVTNIEKSFLVKVEVGAKRVATTFTLDKYTGTASKAVGVNDDVVFTATVKDQYGVEMDVTFDITKNTNTSDEGAGKLAQVGTTNKIKFSPEGLTKGTYSYKVTVGNISRNVSVTVREPGKEVAKKFVVSNNSVDLAVNKDSAKGTNVTFDLYAVDANGVKVAKLNAGTDYKIEIVNPKQDTVTANVENNGYVLPVVVSGSTITQNTELKEKGTYVVTVKDLTDNNKIITKSSFVVTNTQVLPVVNQENTTLTVSEGTTLLAALNNTDLFTVTTKNNGTIEKDSIVNPIVTVVSGPNDATGALVKGTYKIVVKTVDVNETFGSNVFVHKNINVSKTVTITVE